jgi:hypothetical protein
VMGDDHLAVLALRPVEVARRCHPASLPASTPAGVAEHLHPSGSRVVLRLLFMMDPPACSRCVTNLITVSDGRLLRPTIFERSERAVRRGVALVPATRTPGLADGTRPEIVSLRIARPWRCASGTDAGRVCGQLTKPRALGACFARPSRFARPGGCVAVCDGMPSGAGWRPAGGVSRRGLRGTSSTATLTTGRSGASARTMRWPTALTPATTTGVAPNCGTPTGGTVGIDR